VTRPSQKRALERLTDGKNLIFTEEVRAVDSNIFNRTAYNHRQQRLARVELIYMLSIPSWSSCGKGLLRVAAQ
jgi:hypothetical protein